MLGETICLLRRQSGLSQEQLAEKLGVSRQAVSKWESGAATPELAHLLALRACFGVPLETLLGEAPPQRPPAGPPSSPTSRGKRRLGFALCLGGVLCLLAIGLLLVARPAVLAPVDTASAVTLNGTGLLAVLCVSCVIAGLFLLLRKR